LYSVSEDKNIIIFEKVSPEWLFKKENPNDLKVDFEENSRMEDLISLLKSKAKNLKETIQLYYREKGFDYVKWNILYANQKATKNYVVFLKKSLKEDWGAEYREEEQKKEEIERMLREEKLKKKQEMENVYRKLDELKAAYEAIEEEEILRLEPEAIEKCIQLGMPRNFIPKPTLMEKIVEMHQENLKNATSSKS